MSPRPDSPNAETSTWSGTRPALGFRQQPAVPGRRPTGIFLDRGTGRTAAYLIAGIPLVICLIIGFKTADSGSALLNTSIGSGYNPFSGGGGSQGGNPLGAGGTTDYPTYTPSPSAYGYPTDTAATDGTSPTDGSTGYLGGISGTDTSTDTGSASTAPTFPLTVTPSASPTFTGPAATVLAAYAAVNNKDYQTAFNLGLGGGASSGGYSQFAAGYETTAYVVVTIDSVTGDQVAVDLVAVQNLGTEQTYSGTYTVVSGVISNSQISQTG